jgi:hypothetical protein
MLAETVLFGQSVCGSGRRFRVQRVRLGARLGAVCRLTQIPPRSRTPPWWMALRPRNPALPSAVVRHMTGPWANLVPFRRGGSRWVEQAGERTYGPSPVHGQGASGQWLRFRSVGDGGHHRADEP